MINEFNSLSNTRTEKWLGKVDPRWTEVLEQLSTLPSTKMLLSLQAQEVECFIHAYRYEVTVPENWVGMIQSRLPLLQQAVTRVHGEGLKVHIISEQKRSPNPLSEFSDAALLAEIQRRLEVK